MTTEKQKMWNRVRLLTKAKTDNEALNFLQENGLVSDLAEKKDDIAFTDLVRAERILRVGYKP